MPHKLPRQTFLPGMSPAYLEAAEKLGLIALPSKQPVHKPPIMAKCVNGQYRFEESDVTDTCKSN